MLKISKAMLLLFTNRIINNTVSSYIPPPLLHKNLMILFPPPETHHASPFLCKKRARRKRPAGRRPIGLVVVLEVDDPGRPCRQPCPGGSRMMAMAISFRFFMVNAFSLFLSLNMLKYYRLLRHYFYLCI